MSARVATATAEGLAGPEGRSGLPWVVFDYGEVISSHRDALPRLAALMDVPLEPFCDAWAAERPAYDRGMPDLGYWRAVGDRLDRPVGEELAARLTAVDFSAWSRASPAVVALLADLAGAGVPLALLSNAPCSHARVFRRRSWAGHFRHLVFSGETGVAKPDPAMWRILAERLGASPADCVFFDDRRDNVDSALRAGLLAEQWTDVGAGRRTLAAYGLRTSLPAGTA